MNTWFLLALGAAITNSLVQTTQRWSIGVSRYSIFTISFLAAAVTSLMLFLVSYFVFGPQNIKPGFWFAVSITGVLNAVAMPLMLKAYELGEFSSVYSMILMTPIFLLLTSFIFLGEIPGLAGALGVAMTVLGLWIITRGNHDHVEVPNFTKGNFLGILVALIWSISVNFDKLAARYSNVFFAPAVAFGYISLISAIYLLLKHRTLFLEIPDGKILKESGILRIRRVSILLLLGFLMMISQYFHNSALLAGPASYTIAIKRMGVLFGVFFGWLLFREKDIGKKLLGAAIAVGGVVMILFS